VTTHLHLVPKSKKWRYTSTIPITPQWRGAQLKHRDNCAFTFIWHRGLLINYRRFHETCLVTCCFPFSVFWTSHCIEMFLQGFLSRGFWVFYSVSKWRTCSTFHKNLLITSLGFFLHILVGTTACRNNEVTDVSEKYATNLLKGFHCSPVGTLSCRNDQDWRRSGGACCFEGDFDLAEGGSKFPETSIALLFRHGAITRGLRNMNHCGRLNSFDSVPACKPDKSCH
jgi:hypothetical protein